MKDNSIVEIIVVLILVFAVIYTIWGLFFGHNISGTYERYFDWYD